MRSKWGLFLIVLFAGRAAPPSNEMLAAHNRIRSRMNVPALVWSNRLAAYAQQWADSLIARNEFRHRSQRKYGENLFEIRGGSATPAEVIASWAAESRNYDYRSNSCHGVCGHYTQIVWRDTQEVGCAVARGRGRREVWVCNYDPPGNYRGRRPY
jgi:pathogenesis-related protein 1